MLLDALTDLSNSASLTAIGAGATGYSDTLDLSTYRDISVAGVPVSVQFQTLPTSGTGGATINVALQTSADNATWVTLFETSALPIAGVTATNPFILRSTVPAGCLRYLRFAYTPSAVLTAGTVFASLGADWPRHPYYPRNYVA